ncbi:hypothetical protein FB451DRAFT_1170509 [Mycena latifolia]|nr:hypothetical protein FB451DRAFT_1170509 [Mycena latifolia]
MSVANSAQRLGKARAPQERGEEGSEDAVAGQKQCEYGGKGEEVRGGTREEKEGGAFPALSTVSLPHILACIAVHPRPAAPPFICARPRSPHPSTHTPASPTRATSNFPARAQHFRGGSAGTRRERGGGKQGEGIRGREEGNRDREGTMGGLRRKGKGGRIEDWKDGRGGEEEDQQKRKRRKARTYPQRSPADEHASDRNTSSAATPRRERAGEHGGVHEDVAREVYIAREVEDICGGYDCVRGQESQRRAHCQERRRAVYASVHHRPVTNRRSRHPAHVVTINIEQRETSKPSPKAERPSKGLESPLEGAQGLTRPSKACAPLPRGSRRTLQIHKAIQGRPRLDCPWQALNALGRPQGPYKGAPGLPIPL